MPVPFCFERCRFVVSFENRKNESSSFVILFLMSFRKGYSISWKKAIGILKGISPDNLWEAILPANVA